MTLRSSVGNKVTKKIKVTGSNLTGPLTVKLSDPSGEFKIDKTSITAAQAAEGAWITVTYSPKEAVYQIADYAEIEISGGGASSQKVYLTGLTPYLGLNPSSINFGNTLVGETKSQRIVISGLNLNGPLAVQLNDVTGMFSVDATAFSLPYTDNMNEMQNSFTVTYNPTVPGSHSANLTVVGGGAESNTVTLTGTCFESYITVNTSSLDCGTVAKGKTSSRTFTVQGQNLTGSLSVKSNNNKFTVTPATITAAEAAAGKTVTVTYSSSVTGSHTGTITISGGGATSQTVTVSGKCVVPTITVTPASLDFGNIIKGNTSTKTFLVSGTDLTGPLTVVSNNTIFKVSPTTISKANATNGVYVNVTYNPTARGSHSGTITVSGGDAESKTVSVAGQCIQPEIKVSPSSLPFGSVVKGNSLSKSFTVTGIDLTGSLTVKSNNSKFTVSPATITAANAANGVTVTVTYKPTARGNDSGTITVSGGGAGSRTVSVSGTCLVPEITVSPTSLPFGTVVKGNSLSKSFTVTGVDLTGSLSVKSNNSKFTVSPATITAANAANGVTVTVTYKPTARGNDSGTITVRGGDAASKTVSVTGKCIYPEITVSTTSLDCGSAVVNCGNVAKTFTVTGIDLTGSLSVKSNNSKFSVTPATITASNAANGVTVTVTYKPTARGNDSGTITVSGGGASSKTVIVSGTGIDPSINVSSTSLDCGTVVKGLSSCKKFTVTGIDLSGPLTLTSNNSKFTVSPTSITAAKAANGVTVTVTYKPTERGDDSGTITVRGGGATSKTISVSGNCIDPVITVNPTSLDCGTVAKGNYSRCTFNVKGTDLTGDLAVSLSSNCSYFTVSPQSISKSNAANGITVTVLYKPTAAGTHSATITVRGGGADSKIVSVTGKCVVPEITTSTSSLLFAGYRDSRTLTVTGTNLTGSLTLITNNEYFTVNPTTITASQAAAGYTVRVQCNVALNVLHAGGILTISGGGASAKTVQLTFDASGNVPYAPVVSPDDEPDDVTLEFVNGGEAVIGGELELLPKDWNTTTTALDEIAMEAKIYAEGQVIVIESPVEQSAVICDLAGHAQSVNLQVGRNEIPVNAGGLYIVRVGEKSVKLMLR